MLNKLSLIRSDLLYLLPPETHKPSQLQNMLADHSEIRFVSLVGVDLAGNDTDERIPIALFLDDIEGYLNGGVQTDGSSVFLPGIATLDNGKVDLIADPSVNWFIDYNFENLDANTGKPVGTLRIPSFLKHNGRYVCSRSLLVRAVKTFDERLRALLLDNPHAIEDFGFDPEDLQEVGIAAACELEFWVRTPEEPFSREQLSTSQGLQENYWKRTKGSVRTALETTIEILDYYGFHPEMGHKEVGGIKARLSGEGNLTHVMEQIEVDWRFSSALQAADNELFGRVFIKEIFRLHGLEASFMAKPVPGVAGSGEHTHVNAEARLKNGRKVNLFTPSDYNREYMGIIGWGALMGFMKHYDSISPFITATNDAFNRLKPGFEAPTHAAASLGMNKHSPSRNRTVLLGLIRDAAAPMSTRFEVRSPNPHTNTYLCLAAIFPFFLDGIEYAVTRHRTSSELEAEFNKEAGTPGDYLQSDRMYRSEKDVFASYDSETLDRLFGQPPATVYETMHCLTERKEGLEILYRDQVFTEDLIYSYRDAMLDKWVNELKNRILVDNLTRVRKCVRLESQYDGDEESWESIEILRNQLAKDRVSAISLFSRIRQAIKMCDWREVSELQLQMSAQLDQLEKMYHDYEQNQLDI